MCFGSSGTGCKLWRGGVRVSLGKVTKIRAFPHPVPHDPLFFATHNQRRSFDFLDVITWPQWHQCTELVVIRARMSDLLWLATVDSNIFCLKPCLMHNLYMRLGGSGAACPLFFYKPLVLLSSKSSAIRGGIRHPRDTGSVLCKWIKRSATESTRFMATPSLVTRSIFLYWSARSKKVAIQCYLQLGPDKYIMLRIILA